MFSLLLKVTELACLSLSREVREMGGQAGARQAGISCADATETGMALKTERELPTNRI